MAWLESHFLGCSIYEVGGRSVGKKNCAVAGTWRKKDETWSSHQEINLCRQGWDANMNLSTNINSLLNSETV